MKTQIIQLEAYDDTVSVRDKMGWGQTSRILLVWPAQGHPLERRLDLVLLQRHSQALGAQLALVTQDRQIQANALGLNIPSFDDLRQAQTGRWRAGRRRRSRLWRKAPRPDLRALRPSHAPGRLDHPGVQRGIFALSLLAVIALLVVLLPGATIELQTPVSSQDITIPITADETAAAVNLTGLVPARWESIVVEGREAVSSTGTVQVPEKPATGIVKFTNLTQNRVPVPAGTVVSTLDEPLVRFETIKDGEIPAGIGLSAAIEVQAVAPGRESNLKAGVLQAIEGPLGLQLSATNPSPTRGGTSLPAASPSTSDRQKVYASLLTSLEQTAMNELLSQWQAAPVSASFPITSTLELVDTLEMIVSPEEGQPGKSLELTLRLEFKMLVVAGQDLERLVTPLLDASLKPDEQAVPGTLTLKAVSPVEVTSRGQPRWRLIATRQVERVLTAVQVAGAASRLPAEAASQILSDQLGLKAAPQVTLWPEWWPVLPVWPARIAVIFDGE